MHAAFDRQRELQPSATVPYEPERNSPSPKPMVCSRRFRVSLHVISQQCLTRLGWLVGLLRTRIWC